MFSHKKVQSLSVDYLVHTTMMIFSRFGLPRRLISDVATNLTSETFQEFYRKLNIQQSITSSFYHPSNGQVEACIKFVKCTIRKCLDTSQDINLALLQMQSTAVGVGLPSLVMMAFSRPIRGLLLQIDRVPINRDIDEVHYETLETHQSKYKNDSDAQKIILSFLQGHQWLLSGKMGGMDTWSHNRA